MTTTRILLIDDHAVLRSGLRMLLNADIPDAQVFDVGSLEDAMQNAPDLLDVILLDIKLPGINGVDGIPQLQRKWPQSPILVLSSLDEPETIRLALARGAAGFISKAETADKIVALIKRVLHGEITAPTDVASQESVTPPHLTPRQCEVLDLMSQGLSNKLIARRLSLSENTVRGHVQAILEFLQVSSRSEAAFAARRRGLVS